MKYEDISIDELLTGKEAVHESAVKILPEEERRDLKDMLLRIVVNSQKGETVRINIPMPLVQAAIDMGLEMSQVSGNLALENVDLKKILDLVEQGVIGNLMELETDDGEKLRIFVE